MTKLSITLPLVGEKNTAADPKITTALKEVEKVVNGELDTASNLKAESVENAAVKKGNIKFEKLLTQKSIIATEESRENAAFGTMPTPDEVEVVLPENGLIGLVYSALWKQSIGGAGRAAIFLNNNQLTARTNSNNRIEALETEISNVPETTAFQPLNTAACGLVSYALGGEAEGIGSGTGTLVGRIGGGLAGFSTLAANAGGFALIEAAAGAYKISIRFKASAGKVTVKNRKLWAWCVA